MEYVRPHTKRDGTQVSGYDRKPRRRTATASVGGGGGSGIGAGLVAVGVIGGVGYIAFQGLTGGAAGSSVGAQSLRVASARVSFAGAVLKFSPVEPQVTDLGDTARIDYSVRVDNPGRRTLVWDSAQQELQIEGKRSVHGLRGTTKIAAHKSHEVTLSFDVDEDDEPVALHLELKGKRVTIKLNANVPTPVSSSGS